MANDTRVGRGAKGWPRWLLACAALGLGSVGRADEPNYKSEPVSWTFLRAEGSSLSLDGVFAIKLGGDNHWRRRPMTSGPSGFTLNKWDIVDEKDAKQGTLSILDLDLGKVPEAKRAGYVRKFAEAYQKALDGVIVKTGFVETDAAVSAVDAKWPHSMKAISTFVRDNENLVNITYLFPAAHLFILNYSGPSSDEPQWFGETWQSLEAP